jgi:hypothetical protein
MVVDGRGMTSGGLAKIGGICLVFALTFALGGLTGRDDHLDEEKFRRTLTGRLNPKVSYASWRGRQDAWARCFRICSCLLIVAGCTLLVTAGVVGLTR